MCKGEEGNSRNPSKKGGWKGVWVGRAFVGCGEVEGSCGEGGGEGVEVCVWGRCTQPFFPSLVTIVWSEGVRRWRCRGKKDWMRCHAMKPGGRGEGGGGVFVGVGFSQGEVWCVVCGVEWNGMEKKREKRGGCRIRGCVHFIIILVGSFGKRREHDFPSARCRLCCFFFLHYIITLILSSVLLCLILPRCRCSPRRTKRTTLPLPFALFLLCQPFWLLFFFFFFFRLCCASVVVREREERGEASWGGGPCPIQARARACE